MYLNNTQSSAAKMKGPVSPQNANKHQKIQGASHTQFSFNNQ